MGEEVATPHAVRSPSQGSSSRDSHSIEFSQEYSPGHADAVRVQAAREGNSADGAAGGPREAEAQPEGEQRARDDLQCSARVMSAPGSPPHDAQQPQPLTTRRLSWAPEGVLTGGGERAAQPQQPQLQRRYTFGATRFTAEKRRERQEASQTRRHSWRTGLRNEHHPPEAPGSPSSRPKWAFSPQRRIVWTADSKGGCLSHSDAPLGETRAFADPPPLPVVKPVARDTRSTREAHKDLLRLRSVDHERHEAAKERLVRLNTPTRERESQWGQGPGTRAHAMTQLSQLSPRAARKAEQLRAGAQSRWNELRSIDQQRHEEAHERRTHLESPIKQREMKFVCAPRNPRHDFPAPPDITSLRGRKDVKVSAKYTQWEQEQKAKLVQAREDKRKELEAAAGDPSTFCGRSSVQSMTPPQPALSQGGDPSPARPSQRPRPASPEPTGAGSERRPADAPAPRSARGRVPSPRVRRAPPRISELQRQRASSAHGVRSAELQRLREENATLKDYIGRIEGLPPEFADDASLPPEERSVRRRLREAFIMGRATASAAGSRPLSGASPQRSDLPASPASGLRATETEPAREGQAHPFAHR